MKLTTAKKPTTDLVGTLCEQLDQLQESNGPFPASLRVSAPGLTGWNWLQANPSMEKVAWRDRGSDAMWS
ncbi:MAG: hypothetical protein AAGG44_03900, partial [Planctomycetota bacterium]